MDPAMGILVKHVCFGDARTDEKKTEIKKENDEHDQESDARMINPGKPTNIPVRYCDEGN